MPRPARWLDYAHFRQFGVWRLKTAVAEHYRPLRCCHIRVYRQAVPLRTDAATTPEATADCRRFTDVFRFAQTSFPTVLLDQLGPYWAIPSRHGHKVHLYLTLRQMRLLDPVQYTVHATVATTRHRWRQLLRRALNK